MEALLGALAAPGGQPQNFSVDDEASVKEYFAKLLDLYLQTPTGRTRETAPEVDELLDFAEANPELSHTAMLAVRASREGAAAAPHPPAKALPPQWVEIHPSPEFVVKTRLADGRKALVNVCSHEAVAAPGGWEHGAVPLAVREALDSPGDEGAVPLRLPLSCGSPRDAPDAGAPPGAPPAVVVDVVFATNVAAVAQRDERLRSALASTALAHLAAKLGWALEPQFKLPRRRCFDAPPRPQRVRLPGRAPLVSELPTPQLLQPASAPKAVAVAAPAAQLSFEGVPCTAMLARFTRVASSGAAGPPPRLQLQRGELALLSADGSQLSALPLPFEVDGGCASAWWADGGALCARLPVLPYCEAVQRAAAGGQPPVDLHGPGAAFLELLDCS
jgi:hypothetical protein